VALLEAVLLAAALLLPCPAAHAQHVSLWAGGGLGTFLTGGAGDPNGHRIILATLSLPGDRLGLRVLKGTLERSRGIPVGVGDDDFDYKGLDVLLGRALSRLPVDLAVGAARYEEAWHLGYPHRDLGGRMFVHRWGAHLGALRSLRVARFGEVWAEADLHYAPYRPRQLVLFLDVGIGLGL
jgi:hypothetical protein